MTHRGPFQPQPFCDSVTGDSPALGFLLAPARPCPGFPNPSSSDQTSSQMPRGLSLPLLSLKFIPSPVPPCFCGLLALHGEAGRSPQHLEQRLERGSGPTSGSQHSRATRCVSFGWHAGAAVATA